ncbi:MAG: PH domain-containing protein [bacterium]|nr:PH domain-containing protein [bacterium]MDZ4231531.1 PH domain-containing protein [Patescibacteria group bacterium]
MVLKEGEKVLFELRRHWYVLARDSGIPIVLALVPLIALGLFDPLGVPEELFLPVLALAAGWFTVAWAVFFIVWTNYYLDVWIVTNMRIVDIEQFGLFSRDVSEFRLDRIQDVTVEVKGVVPTLLGFGTIQVQTAGMSREFFIYDVENPYQVKDRIIKLHDQAIKRAYAHGYDGT